MPSKTSLNVGWLPGAMAVRAASMTSGCGWPFQAGDDDAADDLIDLSVGIQHRLQPRRAQGPTMP